MNSHDGREREELGSIVVEVYQIVVTDKQSGWEAPSTPYVTDSPWARREARAQGHRVTLVVYYFLSFL